MADGRMKLEWRIWRGLVWALLKGMWIAVTIFVVLVYLSRRLAG